MASPVTKFEKEEFAPLLPVGFHEMSIAALERLCVHRFPDSFTRPGIMENLNNVIDRINTSKITGSLWIDGSFLTEKLNPDDVDILFSVSLSTYLAFNPIQGRFFEWFRKTSLYQDYGCDNYAAICDNYAAIHDPSRPEGEWLFAYWLRQFGFSRDNRIKGLAVVKVPFLVSP